MFTLPFIPICCLWSVNINKLLCMINLNALPDGECQRISGRTVKDVGFCNFSFLIGIYIKISLFPVGRTVIN